MESEKEIWLKNISVERTRLWKYEREGKETTRFWGQYSERSQTY